MEMREAIAEKRLKGFTTYADLRLRRFEPNFPAARPWILKSTHAAAGTPAAVRGPLYSRLHAQTEDVEVIFLQSSQRLSAKREHFGLIATELKNGCQVADVGEID